MPARIKLKRHQQNHCLLVRLVKLRWWEIARSVETRPVVVVVINLVERRVHRLWYRQREGRGG